MLIDRVDPFGAPDRLFQKLGVLERSIFGDIKIIPGNIMSCFPVDQHMPFRIGECIENPANAFLVVDHIIFATGNQEYRLINLLQRIFCPNTTVRLPALGRNSDQGVYRAWPFRHILHCCLCSFGNIRHRVCVKLIGRPGRGQRAIAAH